MLRHVGWTTPNGTHIQENFNMHSIDPKKSNHTLTHQLFIYVLISDTVSSSG
jgi:hypothetical protein